MVASFGTDLALLARNLSVIPQACLYAALVRRTGCPHIHAHWATVSTSAAMLMSRLFRSAVLVHRPRLGHLLRYPAAGREGRRRPLRADLHELQPDTPDRRRRVSRDKIHVLYHGLRIPGRPVARADSATRRLALLTVGRWSEKKGFVELIEALAIVRDEGVSFSLQLIAGEGSAPTRPGSAMLSRHATWAARVDSGVASGRSSRSRDASSDLFVLPCVTPANGAMDGIPNVLIESLAVRVAGGRDAVYRGIPEWCVDGETGLLVNERDPRRPGHDAGVVCDQHGRDAAAGGRGPPPRRGLVRHLAHHRRARSAFRGGHRRAVAAVSRGSSLLVGGTRARSGWPRRRGARALSVEVP